MMKKILFALFTAAVLFATFACKQPSDPAKYTGKGAQQDMAEPKTVTIPLNIIKDAGTKFFTRSIREEIVYKVKQATLGSGSVVETESDAKTNYVDWDLSVGRTEEEALNETLIIKHVVVKGITPDTLDNVHLVYNEIKQWFGRDLQVGDEFWLGYRCSNQDGKELARMAHHVKVGNPTELASADLMYGFNGWYLKATLKGDYPTATADFYLGADEKAKKINGDKPINGHVVDNAGTKTTYFLCPVSEIVLNQPYHVKAHFKDVEFGGEEGITAFKWEDVIYAKEAVDAWNFVLEGANSKKYALSAAKGRDKVAINTADPVLTWNVMKDAAMLHLDKNNKSVLEREDYTVLVSEKEDLSDTNSMVYKVEDVGTTGKKANLKGLQFGKVYYAQVTYSYDIKKANSTERKEWTSPKVSFTTDDGLKSVKYSFDSGLKVNGTIDGAPASGFPTDNPASLSTNGKLDATNGNSAPGLQLDNTKKLSSKEGKPYAESELVFDMQLPATIDATITALGKRFVDKDGNDVGPAVQDKELMVITAEGTQLALVIVPTTVKSDQAGAGNANWTITPASVRLRAAAANTAVDTSYKPAYSGTPVVDTEVKTSGSLTGVNAAAVQGYAYTTTMKSAWLDYRAAKISFTKTKIKAEFGSVNAETDVKDSLPMPKYNGYRSFALESKQDGFHIDNVQYTVKDATFKRHVR